MDPFSLKFLVDFFADLVKGPLQDRLQPFTREGKARRVAFDAYSQLQTIQFYLREFIASLERYIDALEHFCPDERLSNPTWIGECEDTQNCLLELVQALENLRRFCLETYPQISIHQPEIVSAITHVYFDRSQPFPVPQRTRQEELAKFNEPTTTAMLSETSTQLRARLDQAKANAADVEMAVKQFGSFIAKEWAFKDSF